MKTVFIIISIGEFREGVVSSCSGNNIRPLFRKNFHYLKLKFFYIKLYCIVLNIENFVK